LKRYVGEKNFGSKNDNVNTVHIERDKKRIIADGEAKEMDEETKKIKEEKKKRIKRLRGMD
jgi:hypothetical protein